MAYYKKEQFATKKNVKQYPSTEKVQYGNK